MKEIVVVSCKGGTGKTSIAAFLAHALPGKKVLADCDVDAANFELVLQPTRLKTTPFTSGFEPAINLQECTQCGLCTTLCRFDAIKDGVIKDPLLCEGCGVCFHNCPSHAISLTHKAAGEIYESTTPYGSLIHADLGPAIENSGKLVSRVRQEAKTLGQRQKAKLMITDGPPGIGCPAIAALTGASLVLAVTEPSVSGLHDLQRLTQLVRHFHLPFVICLNKCDLSATQSDKVRDWCRSENLPVIGEIPYHAAFRTAVRARQTILQQPLDEGLRQALAVLQSGISSHLDNC